MAGHSRQHDCVLLDDRWQVFLVDALASGSGDRWHVVFVSALASSCGDRWQVSLATIHSCYTYSNELCEVSAKEENRGIVLRVSVLMASWQSRDRWKRPARIEVKRPEIAA